MNVEFGIILFMNQYTSRGCISINWNKMRMKADKQQAESRRENKKNEPVDGNRSQLNDGHANASTRDRNEAFVQKFDRIKNTNFNQSRSCTMFYKNADTKIAEYWGQSGRISKDRFEKNILILFQFKYSSPRYYEVSIIKLSDRLGKCNMGPFTDVK